MVRGRHLQTGGRPVDLAMLLGTRRCGLTVFPSNPAPPQMVLFGGGPLEGISC